MPEGKQGQVSSCFQTDFLIRDSFLIILRPMTFEKIVVVDDDPNIILAVRSVLETAGYSVADANNGLTALRVIKEQEPHLVISDVLMPQMNGFELVDTLKQSETTREIPVILLSQKDTFDDIHRGYQLGVVNYLPKPFNRETLLEAVKMALLPVTHSQ